MKDVWLNALKFGLIFFMLAFALHFIFPNEVDMLTCFIIFAATGAGEFLLGFIKYKNALKNKE